MKIRCAVHLGPSHDFFGFPTQKYDMLTFEDRMDVSELKRQVDSLVKQNPHATIHIDPTDWSKVQ